MAFYEVILGFLLILLIMLPTIFMLTLRYANAEYKRGWEDAKKVYYDDLREEKLKEEQRLEKEKRLQNSLLAKENSEYIPISSDLLMAYGVSTVGGLPKSVREAYNISEDKNHLDLDALINMEREE